MTSNVAETAIGAAVLAAAVGFFLYAANVAEIGFGGDDYPLVATFRKAEGVAPGGDVRLSGVKIGSVSAIELDPQTYQARVVLAIDQGVALPEDSSAVVASDGLLGGAHIAIQPGGSEAMMPAGAEFGYTQSSVNLLDLVGRYISGGGGE